MKSHFPVRISTLLLAGALALVAGGANAASSDACKLIPAAAAAKIIGVDKVTTELISKAGPHRAAVCEYMTGQLQSSFLLRVAYAAYTDPKQKVSEVKGNLSSNWGKTSFTDVKGLGDAAFWTSPTFTLNVFAGGNYIMFNAYTPATAANVVNLEKLARVALANLK